MVIKTLDDIIASIYKQPLLIIAFGMLCVVFAAQVGIVYSGVLTLLLCIISLQKLGVNYIFLIIVLFISGAFFRVKSFDNLHKNHISNFYGEEVKIICEIKNYPYLKNSRKVLVLKPEKIFLKNGDEYFVNGGLLQAKLFKFEEVKKGEIILLAGIISEPENFKDFNYKEYLKSQGIFAILDTPFLLEKINSTTTFSLNKKVIEFRGKLSKEIKQLLPEPHASLLLGILIGTREEFPGEFSKQLSLTGTTHIIAVSGYNVSVLIGLILSLAGKIPRKHAYYFTYLLLAVFMLLVGTDNLPAMRAIIMGAVTTIGMMLGRKSGVYSLLAFAVSLMLLQNPFVYKSLSFQLSFASTLGLIILAKKIELVLPKLLFISTVNEELSVTLAAIIATFPITFLNFGTVSIWAPLANVILAPLIPLIMIIGAILIVFMIFFSSFAHILAYLCWLILEIMIQIISKISQFKYSELNLENSRNQVMLIYFLTLFMMMLLYKVKTKEK